MGIINAKALIQKGLWFLNVGSVFAWLARKKSRHHLPFFIFEGRTYTYREVFDGSSRFASLFHSIRTEQVSSGLLAPDESLAVGLYMDNTPEFIFAVFGAALSNATIFGINTGFRGETLINVINQSQAALVLVDSTTLSVLNIDSQW